ncbi:MAG: mobilization protein [Ruminococcaceae bacterium]|nr:mobilization protein [Oscillospiraceae bacterium]
MAIYHLEAKIVSRGTGRSAVAASAYMSCSAILNDYDGIQHDYTRKGGLVWGQVFLPESAPAAWQDRSVLWNAVEEAEKSKDSRLAREFVPALPVELTPEQWKELLSDFIQNAFVAEGMCADAAIHDPNPPGHNPHAHILLTVRPLNPDGTWQHKTEKEYLCIRNGEERGFTAAEFKTAQKEGWEKQYPYIVEMKKVYMAPSEAEANGYERASKNPKSTKYGRQNPISERWNSEGQLALWREAWANAVNRALERAGSEERVDHRSHKDRGLDEQPTIHEGVTARAMEEKGGVSDRCELNRQIRRDNALLRVLKETVQKLKAAVEATVPALAAAMETVRRNLIEFHYGLRHIRARREQAGAFVRKAETEYGEYLGLHSRIAEKRTERKTAQSELDALGILNIGRRKELKSKVAELTEEIEELRTEERIRMQAFDKEDADGMKEVRGEIDREKTDMGRLDEQETGLSDSIRKEQENYTALQEQAEVLDRDKLTEARLAMRKDSEHQAWERIRESLSSGKVSFQRFRSSVKETDRMLGENGAEGQEIKREPERKGRIGDEQGL